MIYCISDIHGCYNEFMELLELIKFGGEDTLYVLGDVIDRGDASVKCLQFIMKNPNIKMLMGNHELMMLEALTLQDEEARQEMFELWHYNGGGRTYSEFKALAEGEQQEMLDFLQKLPFYYVLKERSKKYFLVHAGLDCSNRKPREHLMTTIKRQKMEHPCDLVWIREKFMWAKALPSYTVIFGHTSTSRIPSHRRPLIWHDLNHKDKIGIDCGCYGGGRLAALRLDDMKEFYVQA